MKQTSAILLLLAAISAAAVSTSRISGASAGLSGGNPACASPLLHSHVLSEIIIRPAFAFKAPGYAPGVITASKDLRQEALLRGPASVGLWLAVTARHGVVQPTVRRALVDVNVVALMVGFEAVTKALHVLDRDDVVGLAEGREDWAGERGNHRFEGPWLQFVHLPF